MIFVVPGCTAAVGVKDSPAEEERTVAPPVAFVTGASRGIGRAVAVALAQAGFDVAISARTVEEGEAREHSPVQDRSDTRPLPGSLEITASRIKRAGRRALVVPADLTDRASLKSAYATVLAKWSAVDVLVNCGSYVGPGELDRVADTPLELLDAQLEANVMAPVTLIKAALPQMLERGRGTIITITGEPAHADPPAAAGAGGWGLGFAMTKSAVHRVAGVLAAEHGDDGIRAFNVQPGLIATERAIVDLGANGVDTDRGAPPEVVGKVVAWLATDAEASRYNGRTIDAQEACAELRLLPGWDLVRL